MTLPAGAMIVAHEKYEDSALYDSYVAMLRQRVREGIYYDGEDAKVAETILAATGASSYIEGEPDAINAVERAAERFLSARQEYEYEGYEVRHPIRRGDA